MLDFEEQGSHYIEERALCKVLQEATPHKPVQKEGEVCPLLRKEHSRALCGSRKLVRLKESEKTGTASQTAGP